MEKQRQLLGIRNNEKERKIRKSHKEGNIWAKLKEVRQLVIHLPIQGEKILGKRTVRAKSLRKEYLKQQENSLVRAEMQK